MFAPTTALTAQARPAAPAARRPGGRRPACRRRCEARSPVRRSRAGRRAGSTAPARRDAPITLRNIFTRSAARATPRRQGARATIEAALADPPAAARDPPGRATVKPKVRANDSRAIYGTVITIDRANFKLRLFKRLKFFKSYGVAVGQPAYPTPTGRFQIQNKQVNPAWTVPNSPWAGELAGPDDRRRLGRKTRSRRAGWASPTASASTAPREDWSIGIARVARLHPHARRGRDRPVPRVPVGTPVLIQ